MTPIRVRVFPVLATIFLIVPIIEIYFLIQVGGLIGVIPTIGLVVLTAVIGAALLRVQGLQTYLRFNQALNAGRLPATEILEGVALLIGGALLLTPGFFTDVIGFICLMPFLRRPLITALTARYNPMSNINLHGMGGTGSQRDNVYQGGNVYDGKVTRRYEDD